MKKILLFSAIMFALTVNAQNWLVNFTGTGASSTLDSVVVENLKKGLRLSLNGQDILHLVGEVGIPTLNPQQPGELKIYPNPIADKGIIEICPPASGDAFIKIYELSGKQILNEQIYLEMRNQEILISGLHNGFYLVSVLGNNYQFSGKITCSGNSKGPVHITKTVDETPTVSRKKSEVNTNDINLTVDMPYTVGDILKLTGFSANYRTTINDIPESDKTISFNFVDCIDADGKNYPVVKIGAQVWMAENLAYLPSVTNSSTSSYTEPLYYVYEYQGTDVNEAKGNPNYEIYGVLYNWPAANSACPEGWHLPTDPEWSEMEDYLIAEGYKYSNSAPDRAVAIAVASTRTWNFSDTEGAVGNTDFPEIRNITGFTALPGGFRSIDWNFNQLGMAGNWWTASENDSNSAFGWFMVNYGIDFFGNTPQKERAESVRCVKD